MTNQLQLPVSPADENRPTGHENTSKNGLPKLARITNFGKTPKKHFYQFWQAPAKLLFLIAKNTIPPIRPLVSDKALFLLAKTAIANRCVTCV